MLNSSRGNSLPDVWRCRAIGHVTSGVEVQLGRAPARDPVAASSRLAHVRSRRPLTNASLIQYKTYGSGRDEMEALLRSCDGDMPRLLRSLERLRPIARAAAPHSDPSVLLARLLAAGCAPVPPREGAAGR